MEYHGSPWDAPDSSLETLCDDCHETRSEVNKYFLSTGSCEVIEMFWPLISSSVEERKYLMFTLCEYRKMVAAKAERISSVKNI
jgi:hypothetical protein